MNDTDKDITQKNYETNVSLDIDLKKQTLKDKIEDQKRLDKRLNLEAINTLRYCLESRTLDPEASNSISGIKYENPFDEFDENKIKEKMFELIKNL